MSINQLSVIISKLIQTSQVEIDMPMLDIKSIEKKKKRARLVFAEMTQKKKYISLFFATRDVFYRFMTTCYGISKMLLPECAFALWRVRFQIYRLLVIVTAADKSITRFYPAIFTTQIFKKPHSRSQNTAIPYGLHLSNFIYAISDVYMKFFSSDFW